MTYAEVSDPLLRQDYYQGVATFDPGSENFPLSGPPLALRHKPNGIVQLAQKLKILSRQVCPLCQSSGLAKKDSLKIDSVRGRISTHNPKD